MDSQENKTPKPVMFFVNQIIENLVSKKSDEQHSTKLKDIENDKCSGIPENE